MWWVEEVVLVSERGGPGGRAEGEVLRHGRRRRGGWEPRNKVPESGAAEQVCLMGWCEIEGKEGKELGQCGKCPVSYQSGCETRAKAQGLIQCGDFGVRGCCQAVDEWIQGLLLVLLISVAGLVFSFAVSDLPLYKPPAPSRSALLFGYALRRYVFDPLAREGDEERSKG